MSSSDPFLPQLTVSQMPIMCLSDRICFYYLIVSHRTNPHPAWLLYTAMPTALSSVFSPLRKYSHNLLYRVVNAQYMRLSTVNSNLLLPCSGLLNDPVQLLHLFLRNTLLLHQCVYHQSQTSVVEPVNEMTGLCFHNLFPF